MSSVAGANFKLSLFDVRRQQKIQPADIFPIACRRWIFYTTGSPRAQGEGKPQRSLARAERQVRQTNGRSRKENPNSNRRQVTSAFAAKRLVCEAAGYTLLPKSAPRDLRSFAEKKLSLAPGAAFHPRRSRSRPGRGPCPAWSRARRRPPRSRSSC